MRCQTTADRYREWRGQSIRKGIEGAGGANGISGSDRYPAILTREGLDWLSRLPGAGVS